MPTDTRCGFCTSSDWFRAVLRLVARVASGPIGVGMEPHAHGNCAVRCIDQRACVVRCVQMLNAAAVTFKLHAGVMDDGNYVFRIPPETVEPLYLGFKKK